MLRTIQYSFPSKADGLEISCLAVVPELERNEKYRGIIQIVHGMSEYKERYIPFMEYMAERKYISVIHDHRGHGKSVRSKEDLGYMYGGEADAMLQDIHTVNCLIKDHFPGIPLILFGHSMGSFLSRAYTAKYPDTIDGTIWCGTSGANPAAGLGIALARAIEKRSGDHHRSDFLNSLAFGKYNKRTENETQFDWLSKDKEEVKKYIDDDYCGFVFTANGFETLFSLLKQISGKDWYRAVPNDKPIFLIAGENDPVGEYGKGVNDVFMTLKKTGHSSVEMKLYPGDRHELLNEIDRDAVTKDITDWLNGQTRSLHVENAAEAVSEK